MANNYSPRRAAPSGEPERRRTSAPRETGYTQERRAPRETGYTSPTRQARPSSDGYTRTPGYSMEDLTPRAPGTPPPRAPPGRAALCGTPAMSGTSTCAARPKAAAGRRSRPFCPSRWWCLLLVIVLVVVLVVRGCSAQPAEGGNSSTNSSSQTSQVSGTDSQTSGVDSTVSGTDSSAPVSSAVSEAPTPAPQEEPQAAPETIGSLLVVGDTAYEYYNFNTDLANQYITAVADAGEKLSRHLHAVRYGHSHQHRHRPAGELHRQEPAEHLRPAPGH